MLRKIRNSMQLKLVVFIVFLFIMSMVINTYITVQREDRNLEAELEDKGIMVATSFAVFAGKAMEQQNYDEIREAMKKLQKSDDEVRYVALVDRDGKVLAHTEPAREGLVFNDEVGIKAAQATEPLSQLYKRDTGEMLLDMSSPVMVGEDQVGSVRIGFPIELLNEAKQQATYSALIMSAVIFFIILLVVVPALRALVKPVKALIAATEDVAQGDFTRQIVVNTDDEVGKLAKSFNQMVMAVRELVGEVVSTSKEVLTASDQLSFNSQEAAQSIQQVAAAIGDVSQGNNSQTEQINEIAKTMDQLVTAIEQVAAGSVEQSHNVQITASTVNQMAIAIEDVAANAQTVSSSASEASGMAQKGGRTVTETIDGMDRIKQTVFESANKIRDLGEQSQQIGEIIQVIDGIAEQTNLLALNAAIEAARAGEHGKGFAVVADEVRKLAERSGKATKEIAELINTIQKGTENAVAAMSAGTKEVEKGAELAKDAGVALQEILKAIEQSVEQIENISAATEEMAASSSEVVNAMSNVAGITQQNTAASEHMAVRSGEANDAIQNIAAISQETAAATQEVNASVEEITATTEEISASADNLAQIAKKLEQITTKFKI